ncbi:MAG: GIY-YIG nuclease family protein [Saprospiraceae bacterium]|nr:GIY-YIG nuclease family protein [Mangrovimonas sp.]MCB0657045.1 GIY-YIG nuclease family protein [Saprospiraceae bacterium]
MYTVYILYSNNIHSYYVGYTSMPMDERLKRHLTNHKGFTGKANDWIAVYTKQQPPS